MRRRVLLVPDGMADEPQAALGGRTPLEAAHTPCMDTLARRGLVGLVQTVPEGLPAGSDVANLSVLGYDPSAVYSGRSPLEAAAIGVELGPDDVAYRCNFVTIVDGVMKDHTAGHVTNGEGRRLIAALQAALGGGAFEFHAGVSYRNLLVWRGGALVPCTPPHDILDRPVAGFLPGAGRGDVLGGEGHAGPGSSPEIAGAAGVAEAAAALRALHECAAETLRPLRDATAIWLWGEGTAPRLPRFRDLYGLSGAVVGAVDLVRGIGRYAGFEVVDVPGATGDLDTDYGAKARAALAALGDHDFVWVHVEAPDEASHMGSLPEKVKAIERVDAEVLAPLLAAPGSPAVLVLPDHHTPLATRTHTADAVPFVADIPPSTSSRGAGASAFGEGEAGRSGLRLSSGAALMRLFLEMSG
jgi:2,3-bisphosphoglycerate-independent phosphoglycerate mutase